MTAEQSAAAAAFERQRAAMAVRGVSPAEKAVLLVLAIMANAEGTAWPSIEQLAARASIGRRTAFRALDGLAERRLVERETTPGKGTRYTLTLDQCQSGTGATTAPVPDTTPTRAAVAPKQPVTTSKRKKTTSSPSTRGAITSIGGKALDLPPLPDGASDQQWADYAEMRQVMARGVKGRPWTAGVARKAIEKLHTLAGQGHNPGAVLDQSVLEGWQGLFPLKGNHHGRSDRPGADAVAGPRRGYAADMLAAAIARPDDDTEGGARDSGRPEGEIPAWLRRRR